MHCLHYQVFTNLGLLQSNQTFMRSLEGLRYHWYLELLKNASMPVYDGIEPTLKHMNIARKQRLDKAKSEEDKKKKTVEECTQEGRTGKT